jgi:hypothetical protein
MSLKSILGTSAYWQINKKIANSLGLEATCLLQHLIDLDEYSYKGLPFYQQENRLLQDLPLKNIAHLRIAKSVLIKNGFIKVEKKGNPAKHMFTINSDSVLNFLKSISECTSTTTSECVFSECTSTTTSECTSTTTNSECNSTTTNTNKLNKKQKQNTNTASGVATVNKVKSSKGSTPLGLVKGTKQNIVLFKLWEHYPVNKRGHLKNVAPILEDFTIEELKLTVANLKRYLGVMKGKERFIVGLKTYLENRCFSNEWLEAEEGVNKINPRENNKDISLASDRIKEILKQNN